MTDDTRSEPMLAQRGPNTHWFRDYFGTSYTIVQTTDVEGVTHTWELPSEVVAAISTTPKPDTSDVGEPVTHEPKWDGNSWCCARHAWVGTASDPRPTDLPVSAMSPDTSDVGEPVTVDSIHAEWAYACIGQDHLAQFYGDLERLWNAATAQQAQRIAALEGALRSTLVYALSEAGDDPTVLAAQALVAVPRCSVCGVPIREHPNTDACGLLSESETN